MLVLGKELALELEGGAVEVLLKKEDKELEEEEELLEEELLLEDGEKTGNAEEGRVTINAAEFPKLS